MSPTQILLAFGMLSLAACTSQFRKETLAPASVSVGDRTIATGSGVAVPTMHDQLEVRYMVSTPSAMQLQYEIRCPGGTRQGSLGESFESYKARRLAELARARQQEVQTKASLVNAVVGGATGQVRTPAGQARADVQVDGQALAESQTAEARLPSWDVGAQSLHQKLLLPGGQAGHCQMKLWSEEEGQDLSGVQGEIQVVVLFDKTREKRELRQATDARALVVRGTLRDTLIGQGADPDYRRKIRMAELQAAQQERERLLTKEREAKAQADAQRVAAAKKRNAARERARLARLQQEPRPQEKRKMARKTTPPRSVQARTQGKFVGYSAESLAVLKNGQARTTAALKTRKLLLAWCMGNGADPYYRAKQRQARFNAEQEARLEQERAREHQAVERQRRRALLEAQVGYDLRTRTELIGMLIAGGADLEYRRKQNEADLRAFEERATRTVRPVIQPKEPEVVTVQVSTTRPGRPAPPQTSRPPKPHQRASWIAGFYAWEASAWVWVPGSWSTPPVEDAIWVPSVEIDLGAKIIIQPGSWRTPKGRRVKRRRVYR